MHGTQDYADRLNKRQIEFIALGSTVGAGFFLGAGRGIQVAGPAILLAYLIAGAMVFVVARSLGEMALADPKPRVFVAYTERYIGPRTAFVQGWSYWSCCVLVCLAELTAASQFFGPWLPAVPPWVLQLTGLALVFAINRLSVRVFGEIEFWMALLKIATIAIFLLAGVLLLAGFGPATGASVSNLWSHGGIFPRGVTGLANAMPVALFAFGGTELIGIAAADAEDPRRSVPRAVNGLLFRLALFYLGATLLLLCLEPWSQISTDRSPIVQTLARIGIPAAATLMNVVLISAVLSSCNSTLYAGARILKVLGEIGAAPSRLSRLNIHGAPGTAAQVSVAAIIPMILLGRWLPATMFDLLLGAAAIVGITNWAIFLVAHLGFRGARPPGGASTFAAPGAPWTTRIVLAMIAITAAIAATSPPLRLGALFAVGLLIALAIVAVVRSPGFGPGQDRKPSAKRT
jgi:L-asparagine transporter-like permease